MRQAKNDPPFGSALDGILRIAGFFVLIACFLPVHYTYKIFRPRDSFRLPQIFHRILLRLLGFRVRMHGAISTAKPTLFVANHASYLDIPVLGSLVPGAFVAKSEVANWPLFGFLAKLQRTVFIERRPSQAGEQRDGLRERLAKGEDLLLFPEGTSTNGLSVLPFKSGLFAVAKDGTGGAAITVQPVSVVCTALYGLLLTRDWRPYYAWYGDMTMLKHLWNVFKLGRFTVYVVFHPPLFPQDFADRKQLAAACHTAVARGIELCLAGRKVGAVPQLSKP